MIIYRTTRCISIFILSLPPFHEGAGESGRDREARTTSSLSLAACTGTLYQCVRGGVGPKKNLYQGVPQGYTKDKKNTTAAFSTPREAAIALAELERDLAAGLDKTAREKRKCDACLSAQMPTRTHTP